MDIYLSPEVMLPESQILNIVDRNNKAVGYIALISSEKKIYVYGHLEEIGVREDFKDLVKPFLKGISKSKENIDIFSYISVGGEKLDLESSK